jgi:predicted ABC-type ATPase
MTAPQIIVLGGPNGAGKTTAAKGILSDVLQLGEFVNADYIAQGLAGFAPERAAFAAGRIMLRRLDELARQRASFAFETTMASKTFIPWLERRIAEGFECHFFYFWLSSAELAIRRVRSRVRQGGHAIPEDVVRRRYGRSLTNFVGHYLPIATSARVYDNSRNGDPRLIAVCAPSGHTIHLPAIWRRIHNGVTR